MYALTGTETEVLLPPAQYTAGYRLGASAATWRKVKHFVRRDDDSISGVCLDVTYELRRAHVVLDGR